jgi:hypothetical protein
MLETGLCNKARKTCHEGRENVALNSSLNVKHLGYFQALFRVCAPPPRRLSSPRWAIFRPRAEIGRFPPGISEEAGRCGALKTTVLAVPDEIVRMPTTRVRSTTPMPTGGAEHIGVGDQRIPRHWRPDGPSRQGHPPRTASGV